MASIKSNYYISENQFVHAVINLGLSLITNDKINTQLPLGCCCMLAEEWWCWVSWRNQLWALSQIWSSRKSSELWFRKSSFSTTEVCVLAQSDLSDSLFLCVTPGHNFNVIYSVPPLLMLESVRYRFQYPFFHLLPVGYWACYLILLFPYVRQEDWWELHKQNL